MFIAAGAAFAGMAGGLTSIAAGAILSLSNQWRWTLAGFELVNFQALFAVSVVLRLGAIGLALADPRAGIARRARHGPRTGYRGAGDFYCAKPPHAMRRLSQPSSPPSPPQYRCRRRSLGR